MRRAGGAAPMLEHEAVVRIGCFAVILAALASWERGRPCRALAQPRAARWTSNLALVAIDTVVVRVLFPAAAVGVAVYARDAGLGLLNRVEVPAWLALAAGLVALDLAIYAQHFAMHKVPLLWRVHRAHHADLDVDVTTGVRFHPVEIVISMLYKAAVILALGPSPVAVLAFEVVLSATSLFTHANVRVPRALEPLVRAVVVTPDMHRVHHSARRRETDSNFGFNLSLWDRVFRTYRAEPGGGHEGMRLGLEHPRHPRECVRLAGVLAIPFRGGADGRGDGDASR